MLFYVGYGDSGPYRLFTSKDYLAFMSGKGGKTAPSKARRVFQALSEVGFDPSDFQDLSHAERMAKVTRALDELRS